MFDLLDNHLILAPGCLDNFQKLKAFHGRMASREKIASYRQTDAFKNMRVNGNGKQWQTALLAELHSVQLFTWHYIYWCQYLVETAIVSVYAIVYQLIVHNEFVVQCSDSKWLTVDCYNVIMNGVRIYRLKCVTNLLFGLTDISQVSLYFECSVHLWRF